MLYVYKGPVIQFGQILAEKWRGGTQAPSEAKALANLMYQYKRKNKMSKDCLISLEPKYLSLIES